MDLIADIGATNTRCALLEDKGQELASEVFQNADFTGVLGLLSVYLDHRRATDRPKRAALAVAAPILEDEVRMVNLDWHFSQAELKKGLGLTELIMCNDFAAVAWGLPQLRAADLKQIGPGRGAERGALAAVGPGTGLGVAALVSANEGGWAVVTGEGGHVSMPAVTDEEHRVVERVRQRHGNCSAERLLSGPGLVNLYVALAELAGRGQPTVTPQDVTSLARQGEPLARKAQAMFFAMLGTVAGDVALTVGARGGMFIAGGIVPQVLEPFAKSEFRERFEAKDAYRDYMRGIPTYVITNPLPAFRGLRQLLGYR
jgi:glucokinase